MQDLLRGASPFELAFGQHLDPVVVAPLPTEPAYEAFEVVFDATREPARLPAPITVIAVEALDHWDDLDTWCVTAEDPDALVRATSTDEVACSTESPLISALMLGSVAIATVVGLITAVV